MGNNSTRDNRETTDRPDHLPVCFIVILILHIQKKSDKEERVMWNNTPNPEWLKVEPILYTAARNNMQLDPSLTDYIVDMAEKGKVADERELLDTLAAQKQLTERANDYLMDNLDGLTPGREKLVAQKMSSFEIVEADTGKSLTDMVQEAKEAMPSQEAYITSKIAHHDMETHDAFGL